MMMQDVEEQLTVAMREAVTGIAAPDGILGRAVRNRRSDQRRGQVAGIVTVTGMAAALVVGVTLVLTGSGVSRNGSAGPAGSGPPSLVASPAVVLPGDTSFQIRILNKAYYRDRAGSLETTVDFKGSYDPAHREGIGEQRFENDGRPSFEELRLIGDASFTRDGRTWWKSPGGTFLDALVIDGGRRWGAWDGKSADSRSLLASLRARGEVHFAGRTGSGTAALDRYTFGYLLPGDDSVAAHRMSGSLKVHVSSGLTAEITQRTTVVGPQPQIADGDPLTFTTSITFLHYGEQVKVTAPPAGQVRTPTPRRATVPLSSKTGALALPTPTSGG